jgi:hypothetical protein
LQIQMNFDMIIYRQQLFTVVLSGSLPLNISVFVLDRQPTKGSTRGR